MAEVTIPQPLTGQEIKTGIAVRMTEDMPDKCWDELRDKIVAGLGKVCTLVNSAAYAKFEAKWEVWWWLVDGEVKANWWVGGSLDDYGRSTPFSMGNKSLEQPKDVIYIDGKIEFTPPDKFRRETEQPVPKGVELGKPQTETSTFSKSTRGDGKRRQV